MKGEKDKAKKDGGIFIFTAGALRALLTARTCCPGCKASMSLHLRTVEGGDQKTTAFRFGI
jgi:hypothetical protein